MKLELQDEKGLTGVFIELPLELLRAEIGLSSSSVESEAQLKESQGKVAKLEQKLATAGAATMDDFTPAQKADFVLAWGRGLSSEDKAIFAKAIETPLAEVAEAQVTEVEAKGEAVVEEFPRMIQGKTDKPGYKYLEHLNLSIRQE